MNKVRLVCKAVLYNCPFDEDAFFEWIKKIKSIKSLDGRGDELYLYFESNKIPLSDLHELFGLFKRYKVDRKQLKVFENESNKRWFKLHKV